MMIYATNISISIIAIQHLGFLCLEMFFWTQPIGQKVFKISAEFAQQSQTLAANQGLYNGFLAVGLIWSLLATDMTMGIQLKLFFLSCVLIAGLYGGWSVSPMIWYIQALPALLTLVLVVYSYSQLRV
jgi:putative membrane protein